MHIKLEVQSRLEMQVVAGLLVNRIIECSESKTPLNDKGVDEIMTKLKSKLRAKQLSGDLISMTDKDYTVEEMVAAAQKIVAGQIGEARKGL